MKADEVAILRELASRYAQIAAQPENAERERRARLVNGLTEADRWCGWTRRRGTSWSRTAS